MELRPPLLRDGVELREGVLLTVPPLLDGGGDTLPLLRAGLLLRDGVDRVVPLLRDGVVLRPTLDGVVPLLRDGVVLRPTLDRVVPLLRDGVVLRPTRDGTVPLLRDGVVLRPTLDGVAPLLRDGVVLRPILDRVVPLLRDGTVLLPTTGRLTAVRVLPTVARGAAPLRTVPRGLALGAARVELPAAVTPPRVRVAAVEAAPEDPARWAPRSMPNVDTPPLPSASPPRPPRPTVEPRGP